MVTWSCRSLSTSLCSTWWLSDWKLCKVAIIFGLSSSWFKIHATYLYFLIRKRIKKRRINKWERGTFKKLGSIQLHQIFKNWNNCQKKNGHPSYMTFKPNIPVRLLLTGYNAAIENLAISVEKYCAKFIENRKTKMND